MYLVFRFFSWGPLDHTNHYKQLNVFNLELEKPQPHHVVKQGFIVWSKCPTSPFRYHTPLGWCVGHIGAEAGDRQLVMG